MKKTQCPTPFFPQSILSEGGLYAFQVVAEEVVGPEEDAASAPPAEKTVANVTLVVTDQDDQVKIAHILKKKIQLCKFFFLFFYSFPFRSRRSTGRASRWLSQKTSVSSHFKSILLFQLLLFLF